MHLANARRLEILQPVLDDGQLLHLPLCQLPLPRCQSSLQVPRTGLPAISVELVGQDLGVGVSQSFPLLVKVDLVTVEGGLASAQDLKLATERDVVQLLPLQQLPLQLLHISRRLVDLARARDEVLLLDDGASPGLV
jgi:hypothetical protein